MVLMSTLAKELGRMPHRKRIFSLYLVSTFFAFMVNAQVLEDKSALENIKEGLNNIYNADFEKAETIYISIRDKYPHQAIPFLFKGLIIYWQNYPIIPGTQQGHQFEELIKKSIDLSEEKLKLNENDTEHLLTELCSVGLLLMYYADNGLSRDVFALTPKAYKYLIKSFEFTGEYPDFYFITGLYNYYRVAYPEAHPVYKPLFIFFPQGDKKTGLIQLKIAADSAIFLKAEANTFLSGIYQSFERDPKRALIFSKKLSELYPQNLFFRTNYICDLLLAKKYNEAEKYIEMLPSSDNKYYQGQIEILIGIIQEKKYKNKKLAEKHYWSGIQKTEIYNEFGSQYTAYGYFGLSRLYNEKNDKKMFKQYRKHAKDLADFEYINFDD